MSEWRTDMQNAPKDGTHLLLRVKPFEWDGGGFKEDVTMTGYWDNVDGAWCGTTSNWDGPFVKPYAWQHLPNPPTQERG